MQRYSYDRAQAGGLAQVGGMRVRGLKVRVETDDGRDYVRCLRVGARRKKLFLKMWGVGRGRRGGEVGEGGLGGAVG